MAMRRPRIGARRGTAILFLVASCVALLATSQPPDQATLTARSTLSASLGEGAPRAEGVLRVSLSAAALPVGSETIRSVTGRLTLTAQGVDRGRLVISVGSRTVPIAPRADDYGATVVPIEQLCPAAEPCDAEVDVAVEWLGAGRGTISHVTVTATLEVVYHGVMATPPGATAGLAAAQELAPEAPGPTVAAQTPDEEIVLGRDHWAAARRVRLTATPEALAGDTLAFFDQSPVQLHGGRLLVTVSPDENSSEQLDPTIPFDPFTGCDRAAPCERELIVRFELAGVDADAEAAVRWSFGARAAFPEDEAVPPGAALTAAITEATDATADVPAISETLSGTLSFEVVDGRPRTQGFRVEIDVPPTALPPRAFGGLPPTARMILTVHSPLEGYLSMRVSAAAERVQDASRKWAAGEGGATVLDNPLRDCDVSFRCGRTIDVSISPRTAEAVEGPIEITWELEVLLAYPALDEVPAEARIDLREPGHGG
jgi:hypothetical protein